MNWDDPASRAALIESVGPEEYNRRFEEHRKASVVAREGGRNIWPVNSPWGRVFMIEGLNQGFSTLEQSKAYAREHPAMRAMTLDEFRATGKFVDSLAPHTGGDEGPGRLYAGGAYIERALTTNGWKKDGWYLLIERSEWGPTDDLASLEAILYEWAQGEMVLEVPV